MNKGAFLFFNSTELKWILNSSFSLFLIPGAPEFRILFPIVNPGFWSTGLIFQQISEFLEKPLYSKKIMIPDLNWNFTSLLSMFRLPFFAATNKTFVQIYVAETGEHPRDVGWTLMRNVLRRRCRWTWTRDLLALQFPTFLCPPSFPGALAFWP